MKIVVTGASGFVGRQVVARAGAEGFDVSGIVRSAESGQRVIAAGGHPVLIPRLEAEPLARAFDGADAVVHLAQIGAERNGQSYEVVNLQGTRDVVKAALFAGVRRIVFFSGLGVAHYGMQPRCTNPYFLSKLQAELELFASGLECLVFRPSYLLGPGGELAPSLLKQMAAGEVERLGGGEYRMQPISVRDAAELVLAATSRPYRVPHVFDLVGPEPVSYSAFLDRFAAIARSLGRVADYRIREVSVAEALEQSAREGYQGMLKDELDCLLCDEVSDPRPLEALLGRCLTPLDEVIAIAIRAESASGRA